MDINALIKSMFGVDFWIIPKIFVLFGLFIYLIFSFVVVRQVRLMTRVVKGMLGGILQFISWIFFLFTIFVFVAAILLL